MKSTMKNAMMIMAVLAMMTLGSVGFVKASCGTPGDCDPGTRSCEGEDADKYCKEGQGNGCDGSQFECAECLDDGKCCKGACCCDPPPPTPTPGTDTESDDDDDCFSAASQVHTPNGPAKMEEINIGDMILTGTKGAPQYEPVLSFGGHKHAYHIQPYLSIKLENTFDVLEITHGHYIPKENGELVWAQELVVGDKLWHSGEAKAIVAIDEIQARGRFHPQTYSGQIVVNNFLCSTYAGPFPPRLLAAITHPLRLIASTFPSLAKAFEEAGGVDAINWLVRQSVLIWK